MRIQRHPAHRPFGVLTPILSLLAAFLIPSRAWGEDLPAQAPGSAWPPENDRACAFSAAETSKRAVGLEANVLWPFFPGGIFELRVMMPILRGDRRDWRGELVTGAYSDFTSRLVRGDADGKVANLSGKLGYRQFLVYGLHVEVSANIGWRHESDRPPSGAQTYPHDIDGFQTRLWVLAGYQHEFSRALYANARVGVGINVYRSDAYASLEKPVVPGGDVNLGVRF